MHYVFDVKNLNLSTYQITRLRVVALNDESDSIIRYGLMRPAFYENPNNGKYEQVRICILASQIIRYVNGNLRKFKFALL